jgi:hypothetical protein
MNQTITTGPGFYFASVWEPSIDPLQLEKPCPQKSAYGNMLNWLNELLAERSAASPASVGATASPVGSTSPCASTRKGLRSLAELEQCECAKPAAKPSGDTTPRPAPDHPAVPEWCEKGATASGLHLCDNSGSRWVTFAEAFTAEWLANRINSGLAALRADRDGWQTQAELVTRTLDDAHARIATLEADRDVWRKRAEDTARDEANALDRIRKLEADRDYWHEQWEAAVNYARELAAANARQRAEIDRLTKDKPVPARVDCPDCGGTGKCDAISLCQRCGTRGWLPSHAPLNLPADRSKQIRRAIEADDPKPADNWRARCRVVEATPGRFDIVSPSGEHEYWAKTGWTERDESDGGYYSTKRKADVALATITTPPPDAAEGGPK